MVLFKPELKCCSSLILTHLYLIWIKLILLLNSQLNLIDIHMMNEYREILIYFVFFFLELIFIVHLHCILLFLNIVSYFYHPMYQFLYTIRWL